MVWTIFWLGVAAACLIELLRTMRGPSPSRRRVVKGRAASTAVESSIRSTPRRSP